MAKNKGPLIRVELSPGRFVKMHRQHAIEAGFLDAPPKMRTVKTENKMITPVENKADDFTEIPGVGKASVELLNNQGVFTFKQLRSADLSGLYYRARQSIEEWNGREANQLGALI